MMRRQWLLMALLPFSAAAEVVLDGTQGPSSGAVGLVNNTYQIDADSMAQISGTNAFFSFSSFNVEAGNTANFTASGSYDNLLARVTGGNASLIDGNITSDIAGANLWLINPNGVLFGAGASIDLSGSFHALAVDYVELPGAVKYHADTAQPFVAVSGNPLAVGVDAGSVAGPIQANSTAFTVADGESISLVGESIMLEGSALQANGGQVQLLAISSSGKLIYSDNVYVSHNATALGTLNVNNSGLQGNVTALASEVQQLEGDSHHDKRIVAVAARTVSLHQADVACQPRVFSGGVPLEFEVREKEEGDHFFIRLSGRAGKAGIDSFQECVQP